MSYTGAGIFVINTAGQPVVDGTVISSTVFNALTADLATGLTTAITKDGQTTPTANIPLGTYKITGLGAGTAATDAVRMSQLQAGGTTFLTAAGTDTITATASPALTAYAAGNLFTFVVAGTNTGAVTLNIDSLGAKAITRDGTTALAANDLVATEVVIVVYDGTQFQVLNPNAATNYRVSGTLGVTGVATMTAAPVFSSATASLPMFTDGSKALVSNAMTGTGNVVMSASPTLTGTIGAASQTLSGTLDVTGATTLSSALTYGGVTLANSVTGTGSMVLSASPTLTGTIAGASQTLSGTLDVTGTITGGGYSGGAISGTTGAFSAAVNLDAGTVSLPGLYLDGETSTGLYRIGANNHGYAVSGAKVLGIASTGLEIAGTVIATSTVQTNTYVNVRATTATPASGAGVAAFNFGSAGLEISFGSGTPYGVRTAARGSLYIRTDNNTNAALYVNGDGGTNWVAVSTSNF